MVTRGITSECTESIYFFMVTRWYHVGITLVARQDFVTVQIRDANSWREATKPLTPNTLSLCLYDQINTFVH